MSANSASVEKIEDASGKRERAKAANRLAILEAGRRVFAQIGYETATVRDIIRGTDLASGTFYNYFKSKEEVFEALADDGARRFKPILRAEREHATCFEDYLRRSYAAYFRFLAEDNHLDGLPLPERRPHVRADTPAMLAVFEEVRDGIEYAIAQGSAPRVDSEYLASVCIGVAQDLGMVMLQRSPPDVDGAAQFAASLILGGLSALPRTGP